MPKDSSFSMHSLLVTHYLNGAWYPKGGATEIAYHMIPIVEKAGGAVLVRAPVNRILFNDAKEACGGCDFRSFSLPIMHLISYSYVCLSSWFQV